MYGWWAFENSLNEVSTSLAKVNPFQVGNAEGSPEWLPTELPRDFLRNEDGSAQVIQRGEVSQPVEKN